MPTTYHPQNNRLSFAIQTPELQSRITNAFANTSFKLDFQPLNTDFVAHTQSVSPEVVLIEIANFSATENNLIQEQINRGNAAVVLLLHVADVRKAVFWMEAGASFVYYLDPSDVSLEELVNVTTKAKFKHRIGRVKSNSESTIRRLNDDLDTFARTAAHDLKSPLQTIKGFAELLTRSKNPGLTEKERDFGQRIVKGCVELQSQIESLLHFTQAGSASMEMSSFPINELIDELKEQLQRILGYRHVNVIVESNVIVTSDRKLLSRILQNLLINAIKYNTSETPEIHITSEEKDGKIALHISDNGVGIPKDEIENVFKPKVRLNQVQSIKGSGLGLATVQRIATALGIQIQVKSEVNQGTTMTLWMEK